MFLNIIIAIAIVYVASLLFCYLGQPTVYIGGHHSVDIPREWGKAAKDASAFTIIIAVTVVIIYVGILL